MALGRRGPAVEPVGPPGNRPPNPATGLPNPVRTKVEQAPAPPGQGYAPSTPVTGWMSDWISSACSPVTRYTTRLATATAWSA